MAATGEIVTAEELGGADVHCRTSGVADHYARNDHHALELARRAVARLNRVKSLTLDVAPAREPLHDPAEIYRMRLPKAGSILELVDVIPMNIRGQGIAWDRSQPGVIYGIIRATKAERDAGGSHKVTVFKLGEKR